MIPPRRPGATFLTSSSQARLIVDASARRAWSPELGLRAGRRPAQGINGTPGTELDSWIAIAADGRVTAYTGKCEFGQGLFTAQTQLIAEELSVPLDRVTLIQCDTQLTPDQGTTSGAQSHPANFNKANLALAGATAREALVAARLDTARRAGRSTDREGRDRQRHGRPVEARDLRRAGRRQDGSTSGSTPTRKRKHPSTWTVLGTPVKRLDIPALATGRFEFVHNVRVPGMLHGRVVRPPSANANLVSVDESSVQGMPGVVKVVVKKNFVGVVAREAVAGRAGGGQAQGDVVAGRRHCPRSGRSTISMRKSPARDAYTVNSGDVDGKLAAPSRVVKATYLYPYQMHGSIGTACAVADVQGDKVTVWSASQAVHPLRNTMAHAARRSARRRAHRLQDGTGVLRRERRRHGVVRRGADVAGGRQAGARAAVRGGRDGLGELRAAPRHRSARRARRRRDDRRVGLRRLVADARRPSRRQRARQRRHRLPRRLPAAAVQPAHARTAAAGRLRQRIQHRAVIRDRVRRVGVRRHAAS